MRSEQAHAFRCASYKKNIWSGELREFADAFGGFPILDTLLAELDRRNEQGRQVQTPAEDAKGLFEWRVVGPVPPTARDKFENGMAYVTTFSEKRLRDGREGDG